MINNPFHVDQLISADISGHFEAAALEVFAWQYGANPVYREFAAHLGRNPESVHSLEDIPFLPVEFFKDFSLVSGDKPPVLVFESSGTTGQVPSKHYVTDPSWYERSFREGFRLSYGDIKDYRIFALLPSYLERGNSSLVHMMAQLIADTEDPLSGFYLRQGEQLLKKLAQSRSSGKKILLIGVSFALLDLAEQNPAALEDVIVMETGGMKGRREEMTREDLHARLCQAFHLEKIHSEYGMTELLSQAYSRGDGLFHAPPWMKVLIRDPNDPLGYQEDGRSGGVNIIDLANVNSCAFIATQDLGRIRPEGGFEIKGRFDNSDVRGCNLMVLS